jgi:gliding motility-associated-like protein
MKKLTALFFVMCIFYTAFADTFIVTSNANSGPGTLREAMTLAGKNGEAVMDSILFNLADISVPGRRIVLESELPAFTSNIILDASSQPGLKFGMSDAKVELYASYSAGETQKLIQIVNCSNIKIFGLKINNNIHWTAWYPDNYCIYINNSNNVEIGNAGKGNVIVNWTYAINAFSSEGFSCKNINIFSNFLGLNEDGETPEYNQSLIKIVRIENLNIGSLDPAQGNIMACAGSRVDVSGTKGQILIGNNKIGTNYSGTKALSLPYGESSHYFDDIFIGNSMWAYEIEYNTDIKVINNLLAGICRSGIYLLGYGKKFYIQGNKIGTDVTGTKRLTQNMDYGIRIENCRSGIIGVENDESLEKNIIAFAEQGSSAETYLAGTGVAVINCAYGITISRNSIFCNQKWGIGIGSGGAYYTPLVTINHITPDSISGNAPPLSKIELFRDDSCTNCEGKVFFDTTYADADGKWSKSNLNTENIVVTATDTAKMTSEFSAGKYKFDHFSVKSATCGKKNGYIKGIQILSGTRWHWEDENGVIVGTDTTLTDVGPGKYRLVIGIGNNTCDVSTEYFEIAETDVTDVPSPVVTPATCGLPNGSLYFYNSNYEVGSIWLNAKGDSIGSDPRISDLLPGSYYLKLFVSVDTSCNAIYGPFVVTNLSGASLNTDGIKLAPSLCGESNGSITGIKALNVTGTPFTQWLDSLNNPVGNDYDLTGILPGKYRFKFKDEAGCDTIVTPFYAVTNEGDITIDTSNKIVIASKCEGFSGSIQQIQITGGENYQWINTANNAVAGSSVEVFNLAPGNYQLSVSNSYGCSKTTPVIRVPQSVFSPVSVTDFTAKNAVCGEDNGSIKLNAFNKDAGLYTFHWADSASAETIGTGISVYNLKAGGYLLFAKDNNGCEKQIFSTHISGFPIPAFDYSAVVNKDDHCHLTEGSISGLKVNGLTGPSAFTWYDQYNNIAGNNPDLQNAGTGTYVLKITDDGVCHIQSQPFIITNSNYELDAPSYQNLTIPRNADAAIVIQNGEPGNYNLWADATGAVTLQQNNSGNFIVPKVAADTNFYIQLVSGSCSAPVVKVNIKVVDKSYFAIPNAFTPNGDGINDRLSVKAIGSIELDYFRIYNQWGELVYETHRLNDGWSGIYKGNLQGTGVFVWIAKGKNITGNVITDKGSFILIR